LPHKWRTLWYPDPLRHLPNLVTVVRIALTPVIVWQLSTGHFLRGLVLFVAAGFTDVLDGWLARACKSSSRAGAYLDPIADKLLLGSVYIVLWIQLAVPWWLVLAIFARDLAILVGAMLLLVTTQRRGFPPSVWGKLSTLLQIVTAVAAMAHRIRPHVGVRPVLDACIWLALVATVWSGLAYLWQAAQPLPPRQPD
jgi:cardiolipin synthase (CMP-forming)